MIKSEVVLKSRSSKNFIAVTFVVEFPRIILPEVLTHRQFSRNTSSSRAIKFDTMVQNVIDNPFVPYEFPKHHKGMQGFEYYTEDADIKQLQSVWLEGRDKAVEVARKLDAMNVSKQLCNRIIEPYTWTKMIITTSLEGLENFFELRCSKYEPERNIFNKTDIRNSRAMAELHMQLLADSMRRSYSNAVAIDDDRHFPFYPDIFQCVEACARVSYNKIIAGRNNLFNTLLTNKHMSPFEHCLVSTKDDKWYYNMQGWKSLRYEIEKEGRILPLASYVSDSEIGIFGGDAKEILSSDAVNQD